MLRSGLDGLRPGLLTSCPRKANRRRKRILTYRRLLSATARSVPDNFCSMCAGFARSSRRRNDQKMLHFSDPVLQGYARLRSDNERASCNKTCAHQSKKLAKQDKEIQDEPLMRCESRRDPSRKVFWEQLVQRFKEISARKPRYPTGKARAASTSKSEQLSDLGIYSKARISPAAACRNGTFIVGYLGFRADIRLEGCTFLVLPATTLSQTA